MYSIVHSHQPEVHARIDGSWMVRADSNYITAGDMIWEMEKSSKECHIIKNVIQRNEGGDLFVQISATDWSKTQNVSLSDYHIRIIRSVEEWNEEGLLYKTKWDLDDNPYLKVYHVDRHVATTIRGMHFSFCSLSNRVLILNRLSREYYKLELFYLNKDGCNRVFDCTFEAAPSPMYEGFLLDAKEMTVKKLNSKEMWELKVNT
jgi:hypothetical protein